MRRNQDKREKTIAIIHAVLFIAFTAFFYIFFQRDLIAFMQATWSRGQTLNNPFVTAAIVMVLLVLLRRAVKNITHLTGRWDAFTWLPSYLVLGFTTAVDSRTLHYNLIPWATIMGGCLLVLLLVCWIRNHWSSDKRTTFFSLLLPGWIVTAVSMVLCMILTNNDAALHQELAAYRYAAEGHSERVAAVGRRSLETTPALTALRNVALAHEGTIGDELFSYPQPYGADGLGVNRFTRQNTLFGAETFYAFLGAEPYGGETTAAFLQRLYRQDDTPLHRDLYVASLLLDGRLSEFVEAFSPSAKADAPRHWREAWLLYRALSDPMSSLYSDAELQPLLDDFLTKLRTSHTDNQTTLNALYLTYGKTYWYYYAERFLLKERD